MRKISLYIVLTAIILLSFLLRFYKITENPPALNWDEVSIGYNAYSILKTGHDEWGQFMPVHFESYGEYKLPGQIYASIPAISIFGLTPLGVRITPVIYGTLTVLLLYLLAFELSKKQMVALLSALFLAVSPWHIQLTRASFESSFALFWVVLGILFLLKGFKNTKYWIFSTIPFAIAIYTYNSARVFVPLFLFATIPFYLKTCLKSKKVLTIATLVFAFMMIPLFQFIISGEGSARYKLVSVTDEAGLIPRVEVARNSTGLQSPFKELVLNRYTYVSFSVIKNYFSHFTPDFLFIHGAGHRQHHPQNIGQLYWIQAPFLLIGLWYLIRSKHKYLALLIAWLLTAFIPVAFTIDSIPHALRTLNSAPVYQIFTAYGIWFLYEKLKNNSSKKVILVLVFLISSILFIYQFIKYQSDYYQNYPVLYSRDWQYGNKEVVEYISKNYDKYDLIVYTREYGEPHMFTLFYLNFPPQKYFYDPNLVRFETHDWVRVERFDKFYFPDLGDPETTVEKIRNEYPNKKILFIGTGNEIRSEQNIIKSINFLNGDVAFELVD